MAAIQTHLFIEAIVTQGCISLGLIEGDGRQVEVYLSLNGNTRVFINVSAETMTRKAAKFYLRLLELKDLDLSSLEV